MASRELQLLSRIIRTGDIDTAVGWGITRNDFMTGEARAMFEHILSYHTAHKQSVIGPEAAKSYYPTFQMCDDPSMHTEALCREVRNNRLAIEGGKRIAEAQALLQTDPAAAITMLSSASADLMSLTSSNTTDVRAEDAFARIMQNYHLRKQGYTMSVANWPWEPIQRVTGGIEEAEYVVFYGRPKSMKSWVLAYIISSMVLQGKRGVIYTKEMGADDIYKRILACIAEIPYEGLRLGTLDAHGEAACRSAVDFFHVAQERGNLICLSGQDCPEGGDTVHWLQSKIATYKPDFAAVDGMYLMSDSRGAKKDHERVRNISRDLRQMTLSTRIPLFATLQANRKAAGHSEANLDELAFSDSVGQDATQIFRVINEKNKPTIAIIAAGAREFELNGWRTHGIPATNFGYFGELTDKEIENAKESDTGDADEKRPNGTRKPVQAVKKLHDNTRRQADQNLEKSG